MAEKKYIELQKALNVCEMHYEHCLEMHDWSGDTTADNIKRDIETLPTADVVEVVRCKNCILRGREDCAMFYRCNCGEQHTWERNNDFCSYGVRSDTQCPHIM